MTDDHPNLAVLKRLDLADLSGSAEQFTAGFVWHYFNIALPDLHGDYQGAAGLGRFFTKLTADTDGTFRIDPLSIAAFGDELVVTHVRDRLVLDGQSMAIDAVVVWRIVDGLITEAWDIPAINTATFLDNAQDK
ncbi:nuclear transport factor 2 family protein [uncultured Tateyamaria sp.]|uniref:nuclear transport factor 2 family protein n=1 Tax=uncultured Tateyamaria sp. TaxID=455651 RepID=UPI0026141EAF|nr:nuclear transport factor 2 family protein [uncultured Tateyamaria sp.]